MRMLATKELGAPRKQCACRMVPRTCVPLVCHMWIRAMQLTLARGCECLRACWLGRCRQLDNQRRVPHRDGRSWQHQQHPACDCRTRRTARDCGSARPFRNSHLGAEDSFAYNWCRSGWRPASPRTIRRAVANPDGLAIPFRTIQISSPAGGPGLGFRV